MDWIDWTCTIVCALIIHDGLVTIAKALVVAGQLHADALKATATVRDKKP